jgi:CCR4-NOT complex subunit CAF16
LRDDLAERGPRNRGVGSEGKAYFNPGLGGYGAEDIRKIEGGDKKGL